MGVKTDSFGGNGGNSFAMEGVISLGLRSGRVIDAIFLNEEKHGGNGGTDGPQIHFEQDEFINAITIRRERLVDNVRFETNRGRIISGGGDGGAESSLSGIRVVGIGGNSGDRLDKLRIKYIENYTPSVFVEERKGVIDVVAPGTSIETFSSTQVKNVVGHVKVMEQVFTLGSEGEAKGFGEFVSKLSFNGQIKRTTKNEIKEEIEVIETNSTKQVFAPPAGHVGLEVVAVNVFRDTDTDFIWMSPIGAPETITMPVDVQTVAEDLYDLTRVLGIQVPGLGARRQQRFGFDFYPRG